MMPFSLNNASDFTFTINGLIYLSEDFMAWPVNSNNDANHFFVVNDVENLTIKGTGQIDGQGYWWWMREYVQKNVHSRPHMLLMERVNHCYITGVKFTNSPYYHMLLLDVNDFLIENLEIRVNVVEQKKLAMQYGEFDLKLGIPTFPLNTDGIDPSGSNIVIRNVNITSYDDSIAVKPADKRNKIA